MLYEIVLSIFYLRLLFYDYEERGGKKNEINFFKLFNPQLDKLEVVIIIN